jgi:hypothetical protein
MQPRKIPKESCGHVHSRVLALLTMTATIELTGHEIMLLTDLAQESHDWTEQQIQGLAQRQEIAAEDEIALLQAHEVTLRSQLAQQRQLVALLNRSLLSILH